MAHRNVLVLGGGAAGGAAALTLRRLDPTLDVTVVGQEPALPYNRTTVNKGLLSGAVDEAAIALPDLESHGIQWLTGTRAVALDPVLRRVSLEGGQIVEGAALIVASGASPRRLDVPTNDSSLHRVVYLRTKADTRRLRGLLFGGPSRVVIAGAGLIGSETAGTLRASGHHVTLLDARDLPLLRHVGPTVARWVDKAHRGSGVDLRAATRVVGVSGQHSQLQVALSDDTWVSADILVVSLGVEPDIQWLETAGMPIEAGGIAVDADQRVPGFDGVYAAGDVAALPLAGGRRARVEHWGAALGQGEAAARAVLADLGHVKHTADAQAVPPVHAYSTYVHGTKLTIVGEPRTAVSERLVLGTPDDARFAVAFIDAHGRISAGVGVGGARAVNQLKPLIERRAHEEELEKVL